MLQPIASLNVTKKEFISPPPNTLSPSIAPSSSNNLFSSSFYPERSRERRVREFPSGPVVQFSSVAQSCSTLCDPMNRSTPDLPVHHQLPESTQTHVHRVGDAIQPSHPLLSPSPPAPNPSQHQGLFQ